VSLLPKDTLLDEAEDDAVKLGEGAVLEVVLEQTLLVDDRDAGEDDISHTHVIEADDSLLGREADLGSAGCCNSHVSVLLQIGRVSWRKRLGS
jgi:hypothetical protein